MSLSTWAARHFYLSKESSYVEQRWDAWPFQKAILDCMSNEKIREVVFLKSARVGYTKMLLAAIGYFAEHKRRNQAIWQPTDDDATQFVKTELDTMLRDVAVMRAVFPEFIAKNKANTLQQKCFLDSILYLRGGKAAKNYRRISVDVAVIDELDAFDRDVEGEGDPVKLAAKRIEGATFPKLIVGSTPGIKGFSHTEDRFSAAALRMHFHVPCPHCNAEQPLRWGGRDEKFGIKWMDDDPTTAAYLCAHCGVLFAQHEFLAVADRGRWMSDTGVWIDAEGTFRDLAGERVPVPYSIGFRIWTAYSPNARWSGLVREFLQAAQKATTGDKTLLKTFVNTTLGETWEEDAECADEHELARRGERSDYELRTVPRGPLVLTAGVDVQDNRFEIVIWGFGRGEEMWCIDYQVLGANPADERDWLKLHDYLQSGIPHVGGGRTKVEAVSIDTGGHFTHQVYGFVRTYGLRHRYFAVKGDTRLGQPVKGRSSTQDVNWRGQIIKRGVKLWHVGTDTAKDLLFGRLQVAQPGAGFVHFPKQLPPEFYAQLTAEARVLQRTAYGEQYRWAKQGTTRRNEALDCTVYALHAAHILDLPRYTDKMWDRLEALVQPATGDLFQAPAPAPAAAEIVPEETVIDPGDPSPARRRAAKPKTPQTYFQQLHASRAARQRGSA